MWRRTISLDRRSGVSTSSTASGQRQPRTTQGQSPPHACVVWSPTGLDAFPDGGDVLDADPVVLDVLAVGQIGGVAGELGGQLPQLRNCSTDQGAAVAGSRIMKWLSSRRSMFLVAGQGVPS